MSEAYDLQQRLQELAAMSDVSLRNFKALHHVSYYTLYQFLKEPSLARPRTLTSVRLICEFLSAALKAKALPLNKEATTHVAEELNRLYNLWWDSGKKLPELTEPKQEVVAQQGE